MQPVVCDCQALMAAMPKERGHAAGETTHMMGMYDPRAAQRSRQTWRERMRGMAAQPTIGAQRTDPQSTRFLDHTAKATKRDQLAVDLSGQGTRQLEWITLTTTE